MTDSTRSARILTYTHMSSSRSPTGMVKGHIMPSIPGDWTQIMSSKQHQKLRWLCRHLHMMERKGMKLGKVCCTTCQVPYYPGKSYGILLPGLDPGSKVHCLLNGIRCDKLSTAVTTVRVHPGKYERDFDTIVTYLAHYINKRAIKPCVKVASVAQTRPAKQQKSSAIHDTFKGKIELKKYFREEYDSTLMAQCQQLYELQKKAGLIKGKKTPESSRVLEA